MWKFIVGFLAGFYVADPTRFLSIVESIRVVVER